LKRRKKGIEDQPVVDNDKKKKKTKTALRPKICTRGWDAVKSVNISGNIKN